MSLHIGIAAGLIACLTKSVGEPAGRGGREALGWCRYGDLARDRRRRAARRARTGWFEPGRAGAAGWPVQWAARFPLGAWRGPAAHSWAVARNGGRARGSRDDAAGPCYSRPESSLAAFRGWAERRGRRRGHSHLGLVGETVGSPRSAGTGSERGARPRPRPGGVSSAGAGGASPVAPCGSAQAVVGVVWSDCGRSAGGLVPVSRRRAWAEHRGCRRRPPLTADTPAGRIVTFDL